ncbi:hypothetical protein [Brasilonema sennae]|uniref:hypothetical protein n=1 Tax=Brasilonema sennae TaxID=1397703 RepID=UPI00155342BC
MSIDEMRLCQIVIPAISTVERLAWEVRHRAQKLVCIELTNNLLEFRLRHEKRPSTSGLIRF